MEERTMLLALDHDAENQGASADRAPVDVEPAPSEPPPPDAPWQQRWAYIRGGA